MFLNSSRAQNGIAPAHRKYKKDLEKYLETKMEEKVGAKVKPFSTMFHKDSYFVTSSAIYRTEDAINKSEKIFLNQDLKNQDVFCKSKDNKAKGVSNIKIFIITYLKE